MKIHRLFGRQQRKKTVGCRLFPCRFVGQGLAIVHKSITGVYFHQIMNEYHQFTGGIHLFFQKRQPQEIQET